MAWIYLAESVESQSPSTHGLGQSLTVSKTDTLSPYFFQECQKESYIGHQSGTTLKPFAVPNSLKSTLFSEDSHARILVLQDVEKAWAASEADFSTRLSGLQKKLTRRLCSSKMSQPLELEDFEKSSEHLPKSGMTVAGRVYLPQALEPHTSAKDGSCWPTPTASDYRKRGPNSKQQGLSEIVVKFPTPTARDWKDNGKSPSEMKRNSQTLSTVAGGQLNPQWVEWLMGYNIGHTELNALGTQWFQSKSGKRLKSLAD